MRPKRLLTPMPLAPPKKGWGVAVAETLPTEVAIGWPSDRTGTTEAADEAIGWPSERTGTTDAAEEAMG